MPVTVSCQHCDADIDVTIECDRAVIIDPHCECPQSEEDEKNIAEAAHEAYADIFIDEG